ncbi:MAG TPA: MipA/OmpV family protein [Steroidobacteraceae bacterium]|nr:MipA/OmpV family protein [Steroidobacteraceae bacterium]
MRDTRRERGSRHRGHAALAISVLHAAFLALLLAGTPRPAAAEPLPLWEFGLGVGALAFNDYRGADTTHVYPLPVPYFVYRGTFLKSDQNGLRGSLFDQDRIELNVSVDATTPVRNNSARAGMPDLRSTVEIGPSLNAHLWRSADERLQLDLRLPARAAFTVEASPRAIGWFYAPHLNLDVAAQPGPRGWKLGLLAGPLYATRRYDDYYYSVAPVYAGPGRPVFAARGGYAGTEALVSLTRRFAGHWIGAYLRHDDLSGASFESSPLVKRASYWTAGVACVWMIAASPHLVESRD